MDICIRGLIVFKRKKKIEFYSLDKILKRNATYNMIIGERSNGKTYAVLKYGIQNYLETGGEFAIIRRWKEDIRGQRADDMFSSLISNGEIERLSEGKYEGIKYYSGKFYLCNYDVETGKAIYNDRDCLGYVFALSDTEHNKSISYPNVETILFDEFLTRGYYLPDEFMLFMNTISTIVRQRTTPKIFMLGNTVNKFSPYFEEMGLNNVNRMAQGEIDIYNYGESGLSVAVEYCKSLGESKENNFYFAFNNPKLKMITEGKWELDIYPHLPVKYTPKDVYLEYFIIFNGNTYQANIIDVDGEMFTYIHNKTTPIKDLDNDLIYTLEHSHKMNYCRSILRPTTDIGQKIKWFFVNDKVFYQNNNVGDSIENYLKVCRYNL